LEELTLPTALVAVDLRSMQAVAFVGGLGPGPQVAPPPDTAVPLPLGGWQVVTQAPVALAMASTMAQPGLFTAVDHPPWLLVDGGAADTLPVDWAFHLGADRVVAVNVTKVGPLPPRVGITTILSRSEAYTTQTLSQLRIPPHRRVLLLEPDTSHVPFPGLSSYPRLLQAGRRVVVENAQRLRAFLQDASPQVPQRAGCVPRFGRLGGDAGPTGGDSEEGIPWACLAPPAGERTTAKREGPYGERCAFCER
jgi:NTE family protein